MNATKLFSFSVFPLQEETIMDYTFDKFINSNITITIPSNKSNFHNFIIRSFSLYALALVIIGTFGNILTIIILCRRNLRRYVTMRYLIAVSVCDIITLYGWNLNNFYKFTISTANTNLEEISLLHCRVVSYLTFVGLQLSSWYLTAVSLDRCFSLYFLTWKHSYGKLTHTKYYIGILAIVCLLLNSHILFFNGYRNGPPNYKVQCYTTRRNRYYIFPQWERVHLVVYNLCPFIIMLSCNIYIIYITIRSARIRTIRKPTSFGKSFRSSPSRHRQLSLMLIIVTFAFVLLTLPSCIYFVFFRHRMSSEKYSRSHRHMIQICLSSIQFTSHAIHFFLYCFSATNFRNELRDFITEICFDRLNGFKSNKSSSTTAPLKLTILGRNNRNKKKFDTEFISEYQQTGYQNALKELQITLANEELNENLTSNDLSTSNNTN
ncbi:unnamed protein product [Rotaria sordida]|uniref:G-protein coupled receptors family 1 profile domain-containing protein n=1 Tax=Rotaria sordida TaxID=392033 RepID=A0A813YJZ7_9BILA|nr:unnamed protein product [Rotaria sordida]CAF0935748.1 unnamed protein product [Rotaria sordida]